MSTRTYPFQAFSLAVLLEIILLLGVGVIMARAAIEKPVLKPVTITLLNEEVPVVKPPEKPPEPQQPKPKVMQPRRQTPQPIVTPEPVLPPVPVAQAPTAFTAPAAAQPVPPASVADMSKVKASDLYAAKVHAAVQAAHVYPLAAVAMHYAGRVRVEFHLRDGMPGESHIVVPSGIGMIDRAAMSAVQNARYPSPPPELRGEDMVYQVWVEFNRQ